MEQRVGASGQRWKQKNALNLSEDSRTHGCAALDHSGLVGEGGSLKRGHCAGLHNGGTVVDLRIALGYRIEFLGDQTRDDGRANGCVMAGIVEQTYRQGHQ